VILKAIAIQDQTNAYQRLEKDVIARRKLVEGIFCWWWCCNCYWGIGWGQRSN